MDYLAAFASRFQLDGAEQGPKRLWRHQELSNLPAYVSFAERFAGCSFEGGLYRVHDELSGPRFLRALSAAFPDFATRAVPFAFDWLGRQFAIDLGRKEHGEPLLLLFEPGTGLALEIPFRFDAFHRELDELRETALSAAFFQAWSQTNSDSLPIPFESCVGYRVPLFLGGQDGVENLELVDMDVYWHLSGQLLQGTRGVPPGTPIRGVHLGDADETPEN